MSSESWSVGWVINVEDQEIEILHKGRTIRLSRNKMRSIVVTGDWIAFQTNAAYSFDDEVGSKKLNNFRRTPHLVKSPQTKCICVRTTAIGSPDVQLQESDSAIHRIWSPHFEYLADPLHLFNDLVNVKPNVAYDVWCRLNSDPKSQYDGVSPILEIHSIEAPSESQMISLNSPWAKRREISPVNRASSTDQLSKNQQSAAQRQEPYAETPNQSSGSQKMIKEEQSRPPPWPQRRRSNPINQTSSLNQPSQNQQFTSRSQESSAETQNQSSESQKIIKEEQLRPTASKVNVELVDSTNQLAEVQHESNYTADARLDLIAHLLCERLRMVQSHTKECQDTIKMYVVSLMQCCNILWEVLLVYLLVFTYIIWNSTEYIMHAPVK
ncbi:unnamed protein product [Anisakis simplex]|uniref:DUF4524 domain-containing protein n=1 Tax=Anisakis simplex TaxID=6269 RepID=A0A0M3J0R9_ANISI|nr:unnamed protein product [Anisakis simplex]